MRDYLLAKRREEKSKSKTKKSKKHEGETPEERRARKERKRAKREAKDKKRSGDHSSGRTNDRTPPRFRPEVNRDREIRGAEHHSRDEPRPRHDDDRRR